MTSPALTQLRQLQQTLYEKAYQEAHSIVAGTSRTILAYSVKFQRSLPKKFRRTTQAELNEAVKKRRIVLYGDFHTLRQSQRGLLRVVRNYTERQKNNKVVIALEMFKAIDQDFIDGYLAGKIPEQQFLDSVNYANEWGFPWPNFKMILDHAKARKLPVIGINTENAGKDSLASRDRYAANCLADAAEKYPDHKIFCLIGEYHLADQHLPKALASELKRRKKKNDVLRILNNVDQYYFELQKHPASHSSTDVLRMRPDFFCIMNSPPWMKWQSFSFWEELRHTGAVQVAESENDFDPDPDLDFHADDSFDVDYQFLQFVKNLAGFLNLKIEDSTLESFHILYSPDGDFFQDLSQDEDMAKGDAGRMIARSGVDGVFFVSKSKTILLTYVSINNLAEAAGQYLHTLLTGLDDLQTGDAEDFYRRVMKGAVGMIASKILNPRRKCMELHHFRQFIKRQKGKKLRGPAELKNKTAEAVLRFDKWLTTRLEGRDDVPPFALPQKALVELDRKTNYELSRDIGQMLGFNLYKKVIANKEPASTIRRLFKRQINDTDVLWAEVVDLYRKMSR